MRKINQLSFLLLLLVCACLTSYAQEKTIDKSFDGVDRLNMNLSSGDVVIKKGSSSSVKLKLIYTYDDENFRAEFEQNGSSLTVKEKMKGSNNKGWSKWTVEVPNGIDVSLNSGSGDLSASGLSIDFKSNSGSGNIDLANLNGEVKINTGSGDVEIDNQAGSVSINLGSGDVDLRSSQGEVDINTGSGNILLSDVSGEFSVNTGSGDIRAKAVTITDRSGFNAGSGDVEVVLAKELNYDISVNSGSGDAELDFNGFEISGEITMKAQKGKGDIIAPFKFDKTEEEDQGRNTTIIKTAKRGSKNIEIKIGTGSGRAVIKE